MGRALRSHASTLFFTVVVGFRSFRCTLPRCDLRLNRFTQLVTPHPPRHHNNPRPWLAPIYPHSSGSTALFSSPASRMMAGNKSPGTAAAAAAPRPRQQTVLAENVFEAPGRQFRPEKICVILRGLPGSGKSHVARLLRDLESVRLWPRGAPSMLNE